MCRGQPVKMVVTLYLTWFPRAGGKAAQHCNDSMLLVCGCSGGQIEQPDWDKDVESIETKARFRDSS
uniref:Putative secreted protein n=1 Tax=Anopheles darlingi TaxID=43151 RepID=A0A2M4DE35_ANODA